MEEVYRCPVCCSQEAVFITDRGKDFRGERICACTMCGTFFQSPRLEAQDLADYYLTDSFSLAYRGASEPDENALISREKVARYRIAVLERTATLRRASRLLEIGCGAGDFLLLAQRKGLDVYGMEPSTGYAKKAQDRGLNVDIGTFPHCRGPYNEYDRIVMFHVLEHLPEPRAVLGDIDRYLAPMGQVIIEVPDLSRSFNARWSERYFQRPHLVDYWLPSLRYLLATTGFDIKLTNYCTGQYRRSHHLLVVAERNPYVLPELPSSTSVARLLRRVKRRIFLARLWEPLRGMKRSW